MQCCMTVTAVLLRGCADSMMHIYVCNCDVLSVVIVYLDHLKFCVVCINCRMYACCTICYLVSNESDELTPCLVQPIGAHCGEVM